MRGGCGPAVNLVTNEENRSQANLIENLLGIFIRESLKENQEALLGIVLVDFRIRHSGKDSWRKCITCKLFRI